MTAPEKPAASAKAQQGRKAAAKPAWTDSLRKMYDDVVAEPLPASFEDLLDKLDKAADE